MPSPSSLRTIWFQIFRTSGARMYWLGIAFVSTSITARVLGPEGRGVVAAASGWVALFSSFAGLSIAQIVLYLATGRPESEWLSRTFGTVLSVLGTMAVVGWVIAFAGALHGGMFRHLSGTVLIVAFAALPLIMWNESAVSFCIATGKIDRLNLWQVIAATTSLAAVVLFVVVLRWGVPGALFAAGVYQLIVGGATLLTMERRARPLHADRAVLRKLISGGLKLHLATIAGFAVVQANVLIVNALRPAAETGYFQLAVQLVSALQMFPVAVNLAATNIMTEEGPDAGWRKQKRLALQSCAVCVLLTVAGIVFAPLAILIVGGHRFAPAVPLLRILLVGLVPMNFSTVIGSQWVGRGMFLRLTSISAATAALSTALNFFVIPRYGATGSAWISVGVYTSGMLVNAVFALWIERRQREPSYDRGHGG